MLPNPASTFQRADAKVLHRIERVKQVTSAGPEGTILDRIMQTKRGEIAAAQQAVSADELRRHVLDAPAPRGFVRALTAARPLGLIAEVKRASPSAGIIRSDFDPVAMAKTYASAGVNCLSVLTDTEYFGGHLAHLRAIREVVELPLLRKDFLLDEYQLLEARAAGADAVLLIAECLPGDELRRLYEGAGELGLDCLIELYDESNVDRVLSLQPPLVGVNNRDLRSFVVDLGHTVRLAPRIVPYALLVSESGIRTGSDVATLAAAGVRGLLIGETLMRSADVAATVRELLAY